MKVSLDTTFAELYTHGLISNRTYLSLLSNGFVSLRNLKDYVWGNDCIAFDRAFEARFLHIPKLGHKSMQELKAIFDLYINHSFEPLSPSDISPVVLEILNSAYEVVFGHDNEYTSYIRKIYPCAFDIHLVVTSDFQKLFDVVPDFNKQGNVEIREYILKFIREVISNLEISDLDSSVYVAVENVLLKCANDFYYIDTYRLWLDNNTKRLLDEEYLKLFSSDLSTRTKNRLSAKYHSIEVALQWIDQTESIEDSCFTDRNSKTYFEFSSLCNKFKGIFDEVSLHGARSSRFHLIKNRFVFLNDEQAGFIAEYANDLETLPYFYILECYFHYAISKEDNEARNILDIFCSLHGLYGRSELSIYKVAKQMDLSAERVRQITTFKNVEKIISKVFEFDKSLYPGLFDKFCLFSDDIDFIDIKRRERLTIDFKTFTFLLALYNECICCCFNGIEFALSSKWFISKCRNDNLNSIENILKVIVHKASIKVIQDEAISYLDLGLCKSSVYFEEKRKLLYSVLQRLNVKGVELLDNEIIVKKNHTSITFELAKILESSGKPMGLHELHEEFSIRFPEYKFDSIEQFRNYMKKPIKAIGKQSVYGLEHWPNMFWGSIRDLLFETLDESLLPIHIDELEHFVVRFFPNTNKKSLASSMVSDENERFIYFGGGFYGVRRRTYPKQFIEKKQNPCFDERLKSFSDFIEANRRFPFNNGPEHEASLYRWYSNVLAGRVSASKDAITSLNEIIEHFEQLNYPKHSCEAIFLANCEKYKAFIQENKCLPSHDKGTELYFWMCRSKGNFENFKDCRRNYYLDLFSYVESLGFKV